jgi:3-dehydroquinate synthetase
MLQLPLKFKSSIRLNNINENEIFRLMNYDKKNREGKIKFVLIKDFGEILVDVSVADNVVKLALKRMKKILV